MMFTTKSVPVSLLLRCLFLLTCLFFVVCTDQSSITALDKELYVDTVYVCTEPCNALQDSLTISIDTNTSVGMVAVQDTFWTTCTSCEQQNTSIRTGAICNDGWRSTSTGSGTCSSHDGVRYWTYQQITVCDTTICVDTVVTRFVPSPITSTAIIDTPAFIYNKLPDSVIVTDNYVTGNYIRFTIDSLGWGPIGMVVTLTEICFDVPFTLVSSDTVCIGKVSYLFDGDTTVTTTNGSYVKLFAPWSAVFKVQGVPHSFNWWAWEVFFYSSIKKVTVESSTSVEGPWVKLVAKTYTEELKHGSVVW